MNVHFLLATLPRFKASQRIDPVISRHIHSGLYTSKLRSQNTILNSRCDLFDHTPTWFETLCKSSQATERLKGILRLNTIMKHSDPSDYVSTQSIALSVTTVIRTASSSVLRQLHTMVEEHPDKGLLIQHFDMMNGIQKELASRQLTPIPSLKK